VSVWGWGGGGGGGGGEGGRGRHSLKKLKVGHMKKKKKKRENKLRRKVIREVWEDTGGSKRDNDNAPILSRVSIDSKKKKHYEGEKNSE